MKIQKSYLGTDYQLFELFDCLYQISYDKKFVVIYENNIRKIKMGFYDYSYIEINIEAVEFLKKLDFESGLYKISKNSDNEVEIVNITQEQEYIEYARYIADHVESVVQYQRATSFYLKRIDHLSKFDYAYDRLFSWIYDFLYHLKPDDFIHIFKLYQALRVLKIKEIDKIDISIAKGGFLFEFLGDDYRKIAFLYFSTMPWEC